MTDRLEDEMLLENSKSGICPHCESEDLDYDVLEIDGETLWYPVTCNNCKKSFREVHDLLFVGHYDEK